MSIYFWPHCFHVTYRTAEVANTWPLEPTDSTIIEATTTIRSVLRERMNVQYTNRKVYERGKALY